MVAVVFPLLVTISLNHARSQELIVLFAFVQSANCLSNSRSILEGGFTLTDWIHWGQVILPLITHCIWKYHGWVIVYVPVGLVPICVVFQFCIRFIVYEVALVAVQL